MSRKSICLTLMTLLIAAVMGGQALTAGAADQVYTLNVNLTVAEVAVPSYKQLFSELEQDSGGRLKFDLFYANSLVAITDIPRGIRTGVVDISMLPTNNYTSQMPLNSRILQFPFMGLKDPKQSVEILTQLQKEFPEMQKEFDDLNMINLGNWSFPPYHLHFGRKAEIRLPADIRGMKIMSNKVEFQDLFAAAGAAQVQLPPPEVYSSIEKNVIDGYINNYAFEIMFGLTEIVNAHTEFGKYGGWLDFGCTVINKDRFAELPPDLQALITKKFAEKSYMLTDDQLDMAQKAYDIGVQRGNTFITLTDAELSEWEKLAAGSHEKGLAEISKNKPVAQAIYTRALELVAEKFK